MGYSDNKTHGFAFSAALGTSLFALLLIAPPLSAQVDTSEWKCEYCPFPEGYEADVEVGATSISDDAARFGSATGYDESGVYGNVDGEGMYASDGYRLAWMAEDLALDSRVLEVEGGRPGSFGFRLGYSELPYRLFNTTQTVYTAAAGDMLELPSDWVYASQTQNMSALPAALSARNIESDRKTLNVGADLEAGSEFSFFVDYRQQHNEGVDVVGGSNFAQAALLPRAFDYETDLLDAGVRYSGGPLSLSLVWFASVFENNADALIWDNPFQTFPGAEQGRLAQEPDNEFTQLSLSGTYVADALKSVVAFTAAMGQGEQDEDLLAYTINPLVGAGDLPRASLDGKVDTTNYALTVTSRPFAKARIRLSYRYDQRDNKTPQSAWSRVVVDGFLAPGSDTNVPYSFERTRLSVVGDYRLFDTLRLAAGYESTQLDRDFQEVAEQSEDSGYGQLRWRPTPSLELDVKGGAARRDIDRFDDTYAGAVGQNPLMRKYYLAYRYRDFGEMTLAFTPSELPVSLALNVLYADDSYSRSQLGLLAADELHLTADLGWTVSEKTSVYLNVSDEAIEAEQVGSSVFGGPNWTATHDDDFLTYGAGIRIRQLADKVDLLLDYTYADGESEIVVDPPAGLSSEFPGLESRYDDLRLTLSYQGSERLQWNLSLRYYRFETEDWALEGVAPDAVPSLLSLGAAPYDEDVFAVGIGVRYSIGKGAETE
jgi:MtrB/PioB family decaheme-associated outer membrane protein